MIPLGPRRAAVELALRSDDELMTLAAAGVMEAFCQLVRRHEGAVRAFCARMSGAAHDGDDLAQDVFLDIWRACGRYRGQGQFRAFLFAAARNRCLKNVRGRPKAAALDQAVQRAFTTAPPPSDQVDAVLGAERQQRLDRVVERLPAKLRDAIHLRFAAELEYGEIAALLRRPEETVRSRVFQGLRKLRKLMSVDAAGANGVWS